MILSKPTKFFLFVACLALADGRAADVDLEKVVGSLIAAEKAYAKLAAEKGFREASISVFADDAVIFAPSAVNGKKFWREVKESRHNLAACLRLDLAERRTRLYDGTMGIKQSA